MCGIVAYLGDRPALDFLVTGLERLEYRGYDSAGVALVLGKALEVRRAVGKIAVLKAGLNIEPELKKSVCGIGHTRWATHGGPSEINAHPHRSQNLALVHNGIIENYAAIKKDLESCGYVFASETDTEAAAHLLHFLHKKSGGDYLAAFGQWIEKIRGSYAVVAVDADNPEKLYCAKYGSPMVLGIGRGENFVASDVTPLLEFTRDVIYLEDGDYAEITRDSVQIYHDGKKISRPLQQIKWDLSQARKEGFDHFMIKEIHDQPKAVSDTLSGRFIHSHSDFTLPEIEPLYPTIRNLERVRLVACGTAWHAACVGKIYFERIAGIPATVEIASELRYQTPLFGKNEILIAVSQSGETADTLAAVELAGKYCPVVAITNVLGSSITRKVSHTLLTQAGPEISVASTKAFSTQVLLLHLLALKFAVLRGKIADSRLQEMLRQVAQLERAIRDVLVLAPQIQKIAEKLSGYKGFFYLGRGLGYPIALEGALKLKEITYFHAEGYPAGELKHGPIALISPEIPTVALVQREEPFLSKILSNLSEVRARKGMIIAVTDLADPAQLKSSADEVIAVPYLNDFLTPILSVVPMQLLAYYLAKNLGRDIDFPRNLAKSVTVE